MILLIWWATWLFAIIMNKASAENVLSCPDEPSWTNTVVFKTTAGGFYELSYFADTVTYDLTIKVTVEGASWIGSLTFLHTSDVGTLFYYILPT